MGQKFFNEMFDEAGEVRPLYAELAAWLKSTPIELLRLRSEEAEAIFGVLGLLLPFMVRVEIQNV